MEDLYQFNRALRFIYIVRNPISRVTSNYMHMYQRGYTDGDFERELVRRLDFYGDDPEPDLARAEAGVAPSRIAARGGGGSV